jgi:sRNA-binding carbon storage regulator CsrA
VLILTRKAGQRITLEVGADKHDRKIVLKVLDIKGSIVRLGIEADSFVRVEASQFKPQALGGAPGIEEEAAADE